MKIFPVEKMCSVFKVSRGGFYAWVKSIPSNRSIENQMLGIEILEAFVNSKKIYGIPGLPVNDIKKISRYPDPEWPE